MLSVRIPLAAFFIASAAANAGECVSDADCASTEFCALSDCASCDPDDPTCVPSDCSDVGVCVAIDPTCASDADCGVGQACAHNDCAEACDPADAECVTDCTGGICVDVGEPPPSCEADSDCEGNDVCILVEVDCGGGSSDPCDPTTGECPEPPPETDCGSGTAGYCGPAYLGECEVDADCGAGFTCESESASTCTCAAPDDGSEPVCDCDEPTSEGPGVCVLELVPCSVDEDCSNDFVCFPAPSNGAPEPDCDPATDCSGAAEFVSGYCAPADYAGTPGGEIATGGEEARNDDALDDDEVDTFDGDFILCASNDAATPRALLPFAALAVFLRRRRR